MQKKSTFFNTKNLTIIGLMAALVFVLSYISIPITESARIHLGNIMCLLSGLLFGPLAGGISAGLGSMLFDLSNPVYASEFFITFINKFAMGFLAGLFYSSIFKKNNKIFSLCVSSIVGAFTYVILYILKNFLKSYFILGIPWNALWIDLTPKIVTSIINAILAVIGSVLLAKVLLPRLSSLGFIKRKK